MRLSMTPIYWCQPGAHPLLEGIQPNYLACGFRQEGIRREAALCPADCTDPILMACPSSGRDPYGRPAACKSV